MVGGIDDGLALPDSGQLDPSLDFGSPQNKLADQNLTFQ